MTVNVATSWVNAGSTARCTMNPAPGPAAVPADQPRITVAVSGPAAPAEAVTASGTTGADGVVTVATVDQGEAAPR